MECDRRAPLALRRNVLTLMSDDNFSPLQRTLFVQFVLPEWPVTAEPQPG